MPMIKDAAASINETIKTAREHQTILRKHAKTLNRLAVPLHAAHKAGVLRYEPSISVTGRGKEWWPYEFTMHVTTTALEGFKDERLLKLLSKLISAAEMKTKDYPEALNRDYVFKHRIDENVIAIIIVAAYVRNDSPTCRKVVKNVKTETVEIKEYEIVCD